MAARLDRLDGLLFAAPVYALLVAVRGLVVGVRPAPSAAQPALGHHPGCDGLGRRQHAGTAGRAALELFRVEAVTASTEAPSALAAIARQHGARLAVVADPAAYPALRDALAGTGIEAAAGAEARRSRPRRALPICVMAAIVGAAGLRAGPGGDPARRHGGAGQQGMPGLRRCPRDARGGRFGRGPAAGRFRAQRHLPGAGRQPAAPMSSG